ncbi:bifunctional 23S rRNA (guanine(2069)-N(7))-methyltransferase RlmK/23S rRNA (guanine(2445)-N(2))-methyltransferase RlmL [Aestuariibacter sp. AA17]|uniref:Ribosomal RNA large subunit methyltransferase K/L n=1 Tax=Fluctibacter corallii TaxID=2984329 RepID=A0ABT3A7A5_9ALTE|nr:bifunctional 23S rRNA (guanine(2069)-N(7))-methyltransferase RlmK/23S rRNA (guanine(2445)-N(2))-methyltransferase RlmL [Aestuariibacter sp. AA17]MCV2884152.1 bifunctional 23S rRNA (guanine(2069)-N(7))-methyltransferase RlmK/23S rRNA (guanine(2445)-N(2))-methyltransferase RlmL [Aestuariibacter sp. AA17]
MYDILATTSLGLDELLASEIKALCPDVETRVKPGQVLFTASQADAYRICLWSRLANRVLIKLAEGDLAHPDDLYNIASKVNWTAHFDASNTFAVDFIGTNKVINNTQFGAVRVKDAIVDQFNDLFDERPDVDRQTPDIRIQARLKRNQISVYLDLGGGSLHQRHYRQDTGAAPLKEHVAAAMLMRSGWAENQESPLIDPMCGSGTIVIEAALMAANIAPGFMRDAWGFSHWKQHDERLWESLLAHAKTSQREVNTPIRGSDNDMRVIKLAKQNADAAGVYHLVDFSQKDATKLQINDLKEGYIVCNPPYGERLGELTSLLPLFKRWGNQLKRQCVGWKMALLTSNRDLLRQLKLVAKKDYKMMNGSLECQLVNYVLDEKNCEIRETEQEGDFANRLKKNIKRLNKWLKSEDTNCYRVYDADLPEYNVAIDRYDDWVVVQEYAAPKNIPEHKTRRRLHEVLIALPDVLGIDPEHIALKVRQQQKGGNQYEKIASEKHMMQVFENGAAFYVNLKDYLDTGLFLDHRITRQRVKSMVKGKDVLNLFSYTGSVSVHAALGGARSVTTVDMSKTYLEWAKRNFSLNKLKGAYEFVQADCLNWLSETKQKFDFIFIDPPSFSNSKRMDTTWDVQRDHVSLLSDAINALNPGGIIMFSNNLRQFKLDIDALTSLGVSISDITKETIPEDFQRNQKIHHCWILQKND